MTNPQKVRCFDMLTRMFFLFSSLLVVSQGAAAQCCVATVTVHPGDDIQGAVNTNPSGTKFVFASGVYHNVSIVPKDYDQFIASTKRGAVLSGATPVRNFIQKKPYWVGNVQVTAVQSPGECDSQHPGCVHPEDLFFDNKMYLRVNTRTAVTTGKWYLDYRTGNVYLTDEPTGHVIEVSTTRFAIGGGNITSVVIRGFVIEKYASPTGFGAVQGWDSTGATTIPSYRWLVQNNEIRYNHGAGIWLGNHMTVSTNFVHHNGEFGISGTGNAIFVSRNEISFNNTAGYIWAWGGGTKFVQVQNLTVKNNNVHDNNGPGLWADINNAGVLIDSNTLSNNRVAGIFHEIGFSATIRNNTVTNDGIDPRGSGPWWGAGILILNSSNTLVYGNTLINCQNGIMEQSTNRGLSPQGIPYVLKNVKVYSNTITQSAGFAAGLVKNYPSENSIFTSLGNQFGGNGTSSAPNTYNLSNAGRLYFTWLWNNVPNTRLTLSQWQSLGNN